MSTMEIRVPDLGGAKEVPVIELLVAVGDVLRKDQGLVTLEHLRHGTQLAAGLVIER